MKTDLKELARTARLELVTYRLVLKDPRTPWQAKALFWLAIGYLLLPFDILPDFIPVLGQVDDLIILSIYIISAM